MSYSWDEVKLAVEREENSRLERELANREVQEGLVPEIELLVDRFRPALEIVSAMVMGLYVAILTLTFNFLLFIWIFHVNFDY